MQQARGTALNSSDAPDEVQSTATVRRARFLLTIWGIGLFGFLADLTTKNWALRALDGEGRVDVVGDLFGFRLVRNPGAAFSTGTAFTEALAVFAICALCLLAFLSFRVRTIGWAIGFGLLLAGISGNLADRLTRDPGVLRGHVIDFLELPNWPIFNIADILINLAALTIIVMAIRGRKLDGTLHD